MKAAIALLLGISVSAQAGVDLKASTFGWKASKITGSYHEGNIGLKSAKLETKDKKTQGEFVFDMNSITVTDLQGENAQKFLGHMKSADFFEVQKYPTSKFVLEKDDGKKWDGKLTIKDKTHPISIPYQKEGNTYTGAVVFDRTKFGMIYNSGNFFKNLGDKVIKDEVDFNFTVKTH